MGSRLSILCMAIALAGCAVSPPRSYSITHSSIDETEDGHGTTRTTVRHVFRHGGTWYVFCGDHRGGRPGVYYSFFVTSDDGIRWSGRKIGRGPDVKGGPFGSPQIPETPNVRGDRIFGAYTDFRTNHLMFREGRLGGGTVTWKPAVRVAEGVLEPRETIGYYPDVMVESDGRLSLTGRRFYFDADQKPHLDPAFIRSLRPGDASAWGRPEELAALRIPERIDGHENVPLPDGKRVLVFRTHMTVYKPGTPGNYLAFHWDGASWSKPVDLGNSDGINGSDKRHCAMLDPATGEVHLLYVEDSGSLWENKLLHRTLAPPYRPADWSEPSELDHNVFTVTMGMDATAAPASLAAVYGIQKETDNGRLHTGEIYLKWFRNGDWETTRRLVSEEGTRHNWYPSVSEDVSGAFGVLYTKGRWDRKPYSLMFARIAPSRTP